MVVHQLLGPGVGNQPVVGLKAFMIFLRLYVVYVVYVLYVTCM
jgi:hypothetical protein